MALVGDALQTYAQEGEQPFITQLVATVLDKKIRFPLLEHAGTILYKQLPGANQLSITDAIVAANRIGSYVLAGIMLQHRTQVHFQQSIAKAVAYIIQGNEWYVCDIIGERVMGHALLTMPQQAIPSLKELARHDDKWIVRSVGVATHYAVKKGLRKADTEEMFRLLLSLASTTDFHTKKGIGWAAKTVAKFHPDIIDAHRKEIDSDVVKQWFKTKIKIGLGRTEKYANRYTS